MQKILEKLGENILIKIFIVTEVKEIKSRKNMFLYFYQLHSCAFTALETYWVYGEKKTPQEFFDYHYVVKKFLSQ